MLSKIKNSFDIGAYGITLAYISDIMYHALIHAPYQDHIRTGNPPIDLGIKLLFFYGIGMASYEILKSYHHILK